MKTNRSLKIHPGRNPAEWVSFVIALLIVSAVIGAVGFLWVKGSDQPARFRVERGSMRSEGGQFYLDITVVNEGGETGQQVRVEATLTADGGQERVTTTFDYIPGRSQENAVLIFQANPKGADIRVVSYQKPS